jgi:chromosome partitioning protein
MATIISLINQKGGCGKSSTAFHLGGAFAVAGFNTLVIDADPQGSLSQGFFGSSTIENLPSSETLAALFDDDTFVSDTTALAVPTQFERISVVRANQTLAPHNVPQPERLAMKQFILREFVESLPNFDVVLIDCPPNLYQSSWNALVAAHFVVIPFTAEDFGAQGLRVVHQAIENARLLNPKLQLLGHLVTRFDSRLLVHRSYENKLRTLYGDTVLTTVIPEASAFKVSLACRQPVSFYSPSSRAAAITAELGRELLSRVAGPTELRRSA